MSDSTPVGKVDMRVHLHISLMNDRHTGSDSGVIPLHCAMVLWVIFKRVTGRSEGCVSNTHLQRMPRPRRLPIVLFINAKPSPLLLGELTTSSNCSRDMLAGHVSKCTCTCPIAASDSNFHCMQPATFLLQQLEYCTFYNADILCARDALC